MNYKLIQLIFLFAAMTILYSCGEEEATPEVVNGPEDEQEFTPEVVDETPEWNVFDKIFENRPAPAFDEIAVKDPSIVFHEDAYHLFYTGRDDNFWRLGYATAASFSGFADAEHIFLESLNGGGYFAAPQVFYFRAKRQWYLIYQSGLGATFATNEEVGNPDGWSTGQSMGFGDGIDFWCISDLRDVYCFYSAQDGSRTIKRRKTSVSEFPLGWSEPDLVANNTFEAVHVYKNQGDRRYYMVVEDIARHQELWVADDLGGDWEKLEEEWAHNNDLDHRSAQWTQQVSHVELIRANPNETLEVESMNRVEMLFQGVMDGNYGDYYQIPYDIGWMRNY